MANLSNRQALAWCLFLALGLSLFGLGGLVSLQLAIDILQETPSGLLEMGGAYSLLLGVLFIALAFGSRRWGQVSALLLMVLSGLLLALSLSPQERMSLSVSTLPCFAILMMAGCIGTLLGLRRNPPEKWLGCLAALMLAGGFANLVIPETARPSWTHLTLASNLAAAKALLVIAFGSLLPFVPVLCRVQPGHYARPVLWLGIAGILATLAVWQVAQTQHQQETQQRAELIANATTDAIDDFFSTQAAAIHRMAERFQAQGVGISADLWERETRSYFRDLPFLKMIALIDHRMGINRLEARDIGVRFWLSETFDSASFRQWHALERDHPDSETHASSLFTGPDDQDWMFLSSPVSVSDTRRWFLLALIDVEEALQWLANRQTGQFDLALVSGERTLFKNDRPAGSDHTVLIQRQIDLPHDHWTLSVSRPQYVSYFGDQLTATLILLGGLTLTTLVMVSRLFGVIATHHNKQLKHSNQKLEEYLDRERVLREANQRIIDVTSDLLCTIDRQGIFRFVSPASQRILGYLPEELEHRSSQDFIHQDDWDESQRFAQHLIHDQSSEAFQLRNRYWHRDGHLVTLDWKARYSSNDGALFCVGRDVTAELKAEALAQQREAFFSITPEMFCIIADNVFVEANHAFVDTLGYERDDLLGRPYKDIVHSNYKGIVSDAVAEMLRGKKIYDLEALVFHHNGSTRWLRLNAAMKDQLVYCSARDVTHEKAVRKALQEKDQLLSLAERMGRLGGWLLDVHSQQPIWSDAVCEIHDLPPGQVPTSPEALNYFTEAHRSRVQEAFRLASDLGLPFDLEAEILSARGRLRWVRVMGQAVRNYDDDIVALQGTFQDITESKETTEQIRRMAARQATIFESITDAFFTLDTDWHFTFLNEQCEQLLRRSREDLLGESLWDVFPTAIGSDFEEHFFRAKTKGETTSFEAFFNPLNLWCEVKAYPSDEGLAVYFRSINERKHAEQERDATMAELQRSNRELQDFAFVASHDLQEPLRKIQTFSDRLLRDADNFDAREQDYLKRMDSAARRMQTLIIDLLSYSRISTRAEPFQTCDLNKITKEVLEDLETIITDTSAQIDVSELPVMQGDPSQLRQVMQNLLSNALKFQRDDVQPHIRVYADQTSDKGWTLVIQDNGVGFDQRYSERMFQPFQRLHSRKEYAGTGIGLAIVRKIVERHNGIIRAKSEPGQGATISAHFMAQPASTSQRMGEAS